MANDAVEKLEESGLGVFINLMTDFGFKRIFGIKKVMLHFLNAVLDIDGGITDLHYDNTVRTGETEGERTAIYDLYCTTGKGERIIVEMQTISQNYFKDRTVFYASRLISGMGVKGKDWNYKLAPVYVVSILNFDMAKIDCKHKLPKGKYVTFVDLTYRNTKRIFYDKLVLAYIELPRFSKKPNNVKTVIEQWLFLLKNLHNLNKMPEMPEGFKNDVIELLFEEAKIAKMNKEELDKYNQSLKHLNEMNLAEIQIKELRGEVVQKDNALATQGRTLKVYINTIAEKENALAEKDNALAEKDKIIADLRKQLGLN